MFRIVFLLAALSICQSSFSAALSEEQLHFYRENGYLIQQGFFQGAELDDLEHHVQIALDNVAVLPFSGKPSEEKLLSEGTLFVLGPVVGPDALPVIKRVVWAGAKFPELLAYGRHPQLRKNVARILDSPRASHLINQIHPKQPGDGVEYDVHRDIDNRRNFDKNWQDIKGNGCFVQTMLAIDPMGEESGGLYVIPRSHHECSPVKGNAQLSEEYKQEKYGQKIPVIMRPGDMLYVHPCLVHFSNANNSHKPRRLFINGYACPGANHEPYPGDDSAEDIALID
ncbi:phytanoyl-CoA dioxygenase family protein [Endozoicomonas sp.]|uniref:phytanoyl-CoA dioxygenase family protein n=1 Tax=Endozoicomonas sp. TaxID=1892382 RepID=UPI00383A60C1